MVVLVAGQEYMLNLGKPLAIASVEHMMHLDMAFASSVAWLEHKKDLDMALVVA